MHCSVLGNSIWSEVGELIMFNYTKLVRTLALTYCVVLSLIAPRSVHVLDKATHLKVFLRGRGKNCSCWT